jgi:hypothetical protein
MGASIPHHHPNRRTPTITTLGGTERRAKLEWNRDVPVEVCLTPGMAVLVSFEALDENRIAVYRETAIASGTRKG